MSGIDDFDIDEDFLRDIEEKEELYFTQCTQANKRPRSTSPKVTNESVCEDDPTSKKFRSINQGNETKSIEGKLSKKNLLFDILESDTSIIIEQTLVSSKPSTSDVETTSIYQAKSNQSNTALSSKKKMLLDLISEELSDINEQRYEESRQLQRPLKSISINNHSTKNKKNHLNKSNFDFKSPQRSNFKHPVSSQPQTQIFSTPKLPKTVVRKFPGPAGLLPDNIEDADEIDNEQIFEEISNYNESNTSKHKTSPTNLCSQDTKKVFCDGAWQLMLNDLPKNFLKGYNISSIKRMKRPKKISLLAAIIHKIDLNAEHPRVMLKDISDSIEGMMHKDIFITYEDVLKTGVVVLLQNVGLLNYKGTQTSSKESLVMIRPVSIMGIYSDTSRLITTPALEEILRSNPNYRERSNNSYISNESRTAILESLDTTRSKSQTQSQSDNKMIITSSHEKISRVNSDNQKKSTKSPALSGSRAQLLQSLGIDLSSSQSDIQQIHEDYQEIENIDPTERVDYSQDIRILNADDAFNSFNIDNTINSEISLIESKEDDFVAELHSEDKNNSINNSSEEKSDQLGDSTGNVSAGFADHLFDDDSNDMDDTDEIISQIDVEAFESNYPRT
ncbi:uncharacterized protein [Chelonus insularis]|uniref:uncharacterized protein n=1 Tax=Chelonus insularis TaxID=460826 RepID=UPI00158DCB76|nr:uncharacterized protein LOC118074591 [Chelonus insularis]XP_034951819.1 uncharacterized protein LOC118074591 [Chelonus insularis]